MLMVTNQALGPLKIKEDIPFGTGVVNALLYGIRPIDGVEIAIIK